MISKKTLMGPYPSQDKIQHPVLPFLPSPTTLQQHWPALGVFNTPSGSLFYGLCTHTLFLGAASLTLPFLPPGGPLSYGISHAGTWQTPKVSSDKMQEHGGSDRFSPSPLFCFVFNIYLFVWLHLVLVWHSDLHCIT